MEEGRCLRAWFVTTHSAAPGPRSGGIKTALQGACWTRRAPMPGPRKPGPELSGGESCWQEPQWSAERRAPFARGASAERRDRYASFGALLPSLWGASREGRRSRRLKEYGSVALAKQWLFDN